MPEQPKAPTHQQEEQQQAQNVLQPSERSIERAGQIANTGFGVTLAPIDPIKLPDGRIVEGNFILGSD